MIFEYKNLKVNYEIFEDEAAKSLNNPPLLLLHGWMAQIESWAPVYLHYMKTRRVYVIDFPGQAGKSSDLTEVWGVPEYAQMTKSFIESQNIKSCDVIGHSFGGRVIIYLASQYKDLFGKIILTDSAGVKPKISLKKQFSIYSYKIARTILKIVLPKEKYEKKLEEMRKKKGSSDYALLNSDIKRETFKRIINLDLTKNLKEIANSTLLVWGENDTDTPLYMAKIMEKNIKDCGLVVLEGAKHFSYLDNTPKYLLVVDTFLNS